MRVIKDICDDKGKCDFHVTLSKDTLNDKCPGLCDVITCLARYEYEIDADELLCHWHAMMKLQATLSPDHVNACYKQLKG